MNAQQPEILEATKDFDVDNSRVRAGFRVVTTELLAGGPVELEFLVESKALSPLHLAVSGDRARQRPGQFTFEATFGGLPLKDPLANAAYQGGPVGVVQILTTSPWHQPLILNEFIRLEQTPERLTQGAEGRLDLACRRPFTLATTDADALINDAATVVAVNLAFDLRRDDGALAALTSRLFDEVMQGPPALRERPLALLLSMRTLARTQIGALIRHPDPSVANRARYAAELLKK